MPTAPPCWLLRKLPDAVGIVRAAGGVQPKGSSLLPAVPRVDGERRVVVADEDTVPVREGAVRIMRRAVLVESHFGAADRTIPAVHRQLRIAGVDQHAITIDPQTVGVVR